MLKVLVLSRPESVDNYSSPRQGVSRRFWWRGDGPPCWCGASVKVMDLFFWGEDKHHKNTDIVGMLTFNGVLFNICYDKST